jgi:hypothetical protein
MPARSNNNGLIEKLAQVSMDLKAMLSVHEERLNRQEKTTDNITLYIEKRRDESDQKLKDVYDTMRNQDNIILEELSKIRAESQEAHKALTNRITTLERYIWMAIGGGIVVTYILATAAQYFKILH